jgi:hypothetical protein
MSPFRFAFPSIIDPQNFPHLHLGNLLLLLTDSAHELFVLKLVDQWASATMTYLKYIERLIRGNRDSSRALKSVKESWVGLSGLEGLDLDVVAPTVSANTGLVCGFSN